MKYASDYQAMKPVIQELFGLTRDAIHIHIGFFSFLVTYLVFKKVRASALVLLPGFIFSVLMEVKDIYDTVQINRTPNIPASIHDIVNTNLIPVIVFFLLKAQKKVRQKM